MVLRSNIFKAIVGAMPLVVLAAVALGWAEKFGRLAGLVAPALLLASLLAFLYVSGTKK